MWSKFAAVAAGGALGALARYGFSVLATRTWGANFPWGTLGVNLAGCLVFGLFLSFSHISGSLDTGLRLAVMTGFLGAFTTFSTFSAETVLLFQEGTGLLAILNVVANTVGGILLVVIGMWLGRALMSI